VSFIELSFRQTATIRPFIRHGNGGAVYGPNEERRCRLQRGNHLQDLRSLKDTNYGSGDVSGANALMFTTGDAIPEKSVVTVNGEEYIVLGCTVMTAMRDHHLEVILQ